MSKSDKELAVDVAIAVIEAHQANIIPLANGGSKNLPGVSLESINNIINSVHQTLQNLPEDK